MANKKIGLTVYGFSVRDDSNTRLELNDFEGKKESFLECYKKYLDGILNVYENDSQNDRVFLYENAEIQDVVNRDGQKVYSILYGRIKTGDYGIESEIVDSDTGVQTHKRNEKEADVMPFGFAMILPAGEMNKGVIVLQSISRYGIKTALHKRLDLFSKSLNAEYRFDMSIIVPRVMLDRLLNEGILQRIRLIRYDVPDELAERYGVNVGVKDIVEERVIRRPRGFLNNRKQEIEAWRKGNISYDMIIQLDDFEYNDLKMEFKLGNAMKTISLRNVENLQVAEDISEHVNTQGGHPEYESLKGEMKVIGEAYLTAMGLLIEE